MGTVIEVSGIIKKLFLKDEQSCPLEVDTDLLQSGICDSLGLVILSAELERAYPSLQIFDQEIHRENFGSIRKILKFLEEKKVEIKE